MTPLVIAGSLLAGYLLGLFSAMLLNRRRDRQLLALAGTLTGQLKSEFGELSLEALSRSSDQFLKLASATLAGERAAQSGELSQQKQQIDDRMGQMTEQLDQVGHLMRELERDRVHKFGELSSQLRLVSEQTNQLRQTTASLRQTFVPATRRGLWGERIAEDVLRLLGLEEHISYARQESTKNGRPDFTFFLPHDRRLFMDVKFPLDNYLRFREAESENERKACRQAFLKDVRNRIRELSSRNYLTPESNSLDFLLLFIPNEELYSVIHRWDPGLADQALKQRVLLCSPITLFGVLSLVREAVDSFQLARTTDDLLQLFSTFESEWQKFVGKLDNLGRKLHAAQQEYETLVTTRRRKLDRPLQQIDALRKQRQERDPELSTNVTA